MKNTQTATKLVALLAAFAFLGAGAPAFSETPTGTPLPGYESMVSRMAATSGEGTDAVSGATPDRGTSLHPSFLGIGTSVQTHRLVGYGSGGLFLAAGAIGAVRFYDMMSRAHAYRDENGIETVGPGCGPVVSGVWQDGQALRWTHVGLMAAGESLYLFDAATGISMIGKAPKTRAGTIHRNAFFVHVGLMATDVILGCLMSNALENGNHDAMVGYGAAHMGIGLAIPAAIIGSGIVVDFLPENP